MNLLFVIICLRIIISFTIELSSFSSIELNKGTSEYSYYFSFFALENGKTPYIFIKLIDIQKIDLRVYLNGDEALFSKPKGDEWINIPIEKIKNNSNIILKIKTEEYNSKMIFIDSSKILNITLKNFLDLNFNTNKLLQKPSPLVFDIKIDRNTFFSIKEENNDENLLTISNMNNSKDIDIHINNAKLEKDNIYRFKLECFKEKDTYIFKKFKILYFMEEIYYRNNTFEINNFTENNFLILNIQHKQNIHFYINDSSGYFKEYHKMISLNRNDLDKFFENINNKKEMHFIKLLNGKIKIMGNEKYDEYLIIYLKNKRNQGFILVFSEKYEITDVNTWEKEIKNDTHALIYVNKKNSFNGILTSNHKNMKLLKDEEEFTDKIMIRDENQNIIYLDSSKENTKISFNRFIVGNDYYNYKLIIDNDLKSILNRGKKDNYFFRKMSIEEKINFFSFYPFDIKEEYYVYFKKFIGRANLYKYKKDIDLEKIIKNLMKPISYYDEENFELVNNKLLIVSGTQFFNYYINFGTLFDFFIQKVEDFNYIEINKEINQYSNNTIKLLNENKNYYILFELNHLIKLDDNFLDSEVTFIDEYESKYILNNKNKIININGNKIKVQSNKKALIYFYEKIDNFNDKIIFEFDKNKLGKNMKINIANKNDYNLEIAVCKDFGFKNYYPMLNSKYLEKIVIPSKNSVDLYIENYYDLLEYDIYESIGEKYYIYLFEVKEDEKLILLNKNKVEIGLI